MSHLQAGFTTVGVIVIAACQLVRAFWHRAP